MTSCNFAYGEQSAIANAYASMYAPKSHVRHDLTESCKKDGDVKTVKTEKNVTKHKVPKGTGSKLGRRPVLPFKKRDAKSTATKFAPKAKVVESEGDEGKNGFVKGVETAGQKTGEFVKDAGDTVKNGAKVAGDVAKKGIEGIGGAAGDMMSSIGGFVQDNPKTAIAIGVAAGTALATKLLSSKKGKGRKDECANESVHRFVIADGDSTLCTTDLGESYFNESGICGETRIYESRCSAIKDIAKVRGRRKAKDKYKVRGCEAVGESFQFSDSNAAPVNEGWWDNVTNAVGNVAKGVGNVAGGALNAVGNVAGAAGNALTGNFDAAGKNLGGIVDAGKQAAQGVGQVASPVTDAAKAGAEAIKNSATQEGGVLNAVGQGAKSVAQGVGNVAGGALNAVGNVAGAAGNALGGNFDAAGKNLSGVVDAGKQMAQGVGQVAKPVTDTAGGVLQGTGKALTAAGQAATGDMSGFKQFFNNGQQQQQQTPPMTDAQKQYQQNGGAGPVSDEEAKKKNAAAAQTAQPQNATGMQSPLMAGMSPNVASAVNAAMGNGGTTPQGKMAAPAQQNANGGQDNAAKKAQLQKQIEDLQKQLQALG